MMAGRHSALHEAIRTEVVFGVCSIRAGGNRGRLRIMESQPRAVNSTGEAVGFLLSLFAGGLHSLGGRIGCPFGGSLAVRLFILILCGCDILSFIIVDIATDFEIQIGFRQRHTRGRAICRRMRFTRRDSCVRRRLEGLQSSGRIRSDPKVAGKRGSDVGRSRLSIHLFNVSIESNRNARLQIPDSLSNPNAQEKNEHA